jgi:hypothetical protein
LFESVKGFENRGVKSRLALGDRRQPFSLIWEKVSAGLASCPGVVTVEAL